MGDFGRLRRVRLDDIISCLEAGDCCPCLGEEGEVYVLVSLGKLLSVAEAKVNVLVRGGAGGNSGDVWWVWKFSIFG